MLTEGLAKEFATSDYTSLLHFVVEYPSRKGIWSVVQQGKGEE